MNEQVDADGVITVIAEQAPRAVAVQHDNSQSGAMLRMIEAAVMRPDFDVEKMRALMDMKRQFDADEARKAYTDAMARFKAVPISIAKNKHVNYKNKNGGVTEYDHATLGNVVKAVAAGLAEHGLSHAWVTHRLESGRIQVTCTITHRLGHQEAVTLDAAPDESGGKNSIQAVGSTVTYLQRYTLLAITGLSTDEADDDGAAAGAAVTTAKNDMAANLMNSLESQLNAADTVAKVSGIWEAGLVALKETGNQAAQAELRGLVIARRDALAPAKVAA